MKTSPVDEGSQPTLVVVTGPPRSGTAAVAEAIAKAVPCPLVRRDAIKEGAVHAHGEAFEAAAGDALTQRTFTIFFDVLRTLVTNGVTVVAEASFQDRLWRIGLEPLTSLAQLRIVQCKVDPAVGRERRDVAHETSGARAHARIIGESVEDWAAAYASFDRLSIPAPSIDIDTTDGYVPGLAEIAAFVLRA